jgi:preprotein translocase subunit YajC
MFISSAFAQTAPAAASGGDMQSTLMSMLPLLLMFVVLYFVMIRPQMKKQKEHRAMIDALAKGDRRGSADAAQRRGASVAKRHFEVISPGFVCGVLAVKTPFLYSLRESL